MPLLLVTTPSGSCSSRCDMHCIICRPCPCNGCLSGVSCCPLGSNEGSTCADASLQKTF